MEDESRMPELSLSFMSRKDSVPKFQSGFLFFALLA